MRPILKSISLLSLLASPAFAHHSAAMFDHTKIIPLEGTVKSWQWINPHSWLEVVIPDGKGATTDASFEIGSPNTLYRNGWRHDSFKPGDHVKITYEPRIDGKPGGQLYTAQPQGAAEPLSWLPKGRY